MNTLKVVLGCSFCSTPFMVQVRIQVSLRCVSPAPCSAAFKIHVWFLSLPIWHATSKQWYKHSILWYRSLKVTKLYLKFECTNVILDIFFFLNNLAQRQGDHKMPAASEMANTHHELPWGLANRCFMNLWVSPHSVFCLTLTKQTEPFYLAVHV